MPEVVKWMIRDQGERFYEGSDGGEALAAEEPYQPDWVSMDSQSRRKERNSAGPSMILRPWKLSPPPCVSPVMAAKLTIS